MVSITLQTSIDSSENIPDSSSACSTHEEIADARVIKECVVRGGLVPDHLIIKTVLKRLKEIDLEYNGNWLLDGFPRTQKQVLSILLNFQRCCLFFSRVEKAISLCNSSDVYPDCIIILDADISTTYERVMGRRIDPKTGLPI